MNSIAEYLHLNQYNNTTKIFSLEEFKLFFQTHQISSQDLVILKYSPKTYIIWIPNQSKAQIVINHNDKDLNKIEQYFIEEIVSQIIDIRKWEKSFLRFLYSEIKDRYIFLIVIVWISLIIPHIFSSGLVDFSKNIINLVFPLIGVYFALMVIFLSSNTINFTNDKFESWKVSEYFSNDKNIAYLSVYTMLYILIIFSIISLSWKDWYHIIRKWILIERYLLSLSIWIIIYLVFINFWNLIEYYMTTQQNFKLWKMKDEFFENISKKPGNNKFIE